MLRWTAICFVLFFPFAACAQVVSVRSGDHESFTRIAFDFPSRIPWTLENSDGEAVLTFDRKNLSFDFSSVFLRIQKNRISDIGYDESETKVVLKFACNCSSEGFWFGRSMLVIDVFEAPRDASISNERDGDGARSFDDTTGLSTSDLRLLQGRISPSGTLLRNALADSDGTVTKVDSPKPLDADLSQSRDELARQIGRAASQGLLETKSILPKPVDQNKKKSNENAAPEAPLKPQFPNRSKAPRNVQIDIQTSIDRDFLDVLNERDVAALSPGCLDKELLNIASWGTSAPFWEQVGPLRSQLTGEFDRTQELAVKNLARVYLYFGFGSEARQVIALLPEEDEQTWILSAMADVMDDGAATGSILSQQFQCAARNALWSVLSNLRIPKDTRLDKDGIILSFSGLPHHLKAHLGPILAERFLATGHKEESASVLRILDRMEETRSTASNFVAADMVRKDGKLEDAEEILQTVVEKNGVLSPDALSMKIESQFDRGAIVSFDYAQLAASYAFEHQGTPLGEQMERAHILALAASGAFEEAFSEIDRLEERARKDAEDIRARITARLSTNAEPIEILRHVLAGDTAASNKLEPEVALKLADHLLESGFLDQAQKMLQRSFVGEVANSAKKMRAETALALGKPRQAEVELLGLDGKDVNVLRARARSMLGEHEQAFALFQSAGLTEEASREAWLADDWSNTKSETGLETNENDSEDETQTGALAINRSLLAETDAIRESLQALMSDAPVPDLEN